MGCRSHGPGYTIYTADPPRFTTVEDLERRADQWGSLAHCLAANGDLAGAERCMRAKGALDVKIEQSANRIIHEGGRDGTAPCD